jgi:hypothetical protein
MEGEAAFNRCLRHLAKVNGWTAQQTQEHVNTAFLDWQARSKHQWTLDLAWLRDAKL